MNIEWKKIESIDELPKDGTRFLALWKGLICIAQYCTYDEKFFLSFAPGEYGKSWEVTQSRLKKFSHIMFLNYPDAYPDDFVSIK
jgi:hypothetical protein